MSYYFIYKEKGHSLNAQKVLFLLIIIFMSLETLAVFCQDSNYTPVDNIAFPEYDVENVNST